MINKKYKLPCPRCGQENIITLDNIYVRCTNCRFPLIVVRVVKKIKINGNHHLHGGEARKQKIIKTTKQTNMEKIK